MRKALWFCTVAAALITPAYLAAQEPPKGEAERQSPPSQTDGSANTIAPMGTNPGTTNAQPQAPQADQAKPADVGPAQANTANTGNSNAGSNWPLGSTRQTAPSTVSAENDKLDKMPIIGYSFWLSDDEKKMIVQGVANAPKAEGKINSAKVADLLPADVESVNFPAELAQKVPMAGRYAYVKTENRVLVIDPNLKIIVAEVKT
jgi:hypothetical protein